MLGFLATDAEKAVSRSGNGCGVGGCLGHVQHQGAGKVVAQL